MNNCEMIDIKQAGDLNYMQHALKQAQLAFDADEVPIGAVIVNSQTGEVVAESHNMVESRKNPLKHAEIIVIEEACLKLGSKYLYNHDIFITVEPCCMCISAISLARIENVFYGVEEEKMGGVVSVKNVFDQKSCYRVPLIHNALYQEESKILMQEYFRKKRRK